MERALRYGKPSKEESPKLLQKGIENSSRRSQETYETLQNLIKSAKVSFHIW